MNELIRGIDQAKAEKEALHKNYKEQIKNLVGVVVSITKKN